MNVPSPMCELQALSESPQHFVEVPRTSWKFTLRYSVKLCNLWTCGKFCKLVSITANLWQFLRCLQQILRTRDEFYELMTSSANFRQVMHRVVNFSLSMFRRFANMVCWHHFITPSQNYENPQEIHRNSTYLWKIRRYSRLIRISVGSLKIC